MTSLAPSLREPVREALGQLLYERILPTHAAPWSDRGLNNQEEWKRAAEAMIERYHLFEPANGTSALEATVAKQALVIAARRRQIARSRRWLAWLV
jgi:hypothetical protein